MDKIPDSAIEAVARHINERNNKQYSIPVIGSPNNPETPQIFEIIDFSVIDDSDYRFYAIDGTTNSQEFYNGLYIGIYAAGYICYYHGKQIRMNTTTDPVILGRSYYPENILVSDDSHLNGIYEELMSMAPVVNLLKFWGSPSENIFAFSKEDICRRLSTLLSFCQDLLEWALVFEIANLDGTKPGDYILRDGALRSLQVKQEFLIKLGAHLREKGIKTVAVTKRSQIKMELSYTFKQIDSYLQDQLKPKYPFIAKDPQRQKLCCWFQVPKSVLAVSYSGNMFANSGLKGGRGFGVFFVARLDYVEKLQNYDWMVIDLNIFDVYPDIKSKADSAVLDIEALKRIFFELTRLTQEHYILGYPYPLVEAHNFISLKREFKEELVKRVKSALYREQRMDNVDIENLFLDAHDRF
jgi:hypothetical protein